MPPDLLVLSGAAACERSGERVLAEWHATDLVGAI